MTVLVFFGISEFQDVFHAPKLLASIYIFMLVFLMTVVGTVCALFFRWLFVKKPRLCDIILQQRIYEVDHR